MTAIKKNTHESTGDSPVPEHVPSGEALQNQSSAINEKNVLARIILMLRRLQVSPKNFSKPTLEQAASRYFKEINGISERVSHEIGQQSSLLQFPDRAERLLSWMVEYGVKREELAGSLLRSCRLLMQNPESLHQKFKNHAGLLCAYGVSPDQLIQSFLIKPEVMTRCEHELERKLVFTLAISGTQAFALNPNQSPSYNERMEYILFQRPISLEFGDDNYLLRLVASEILQDRKPDKNLLTKTRQHIESQVVKALAPKLDGLVIPNPFSFRELRDVTDFNSVFGGYTAAVVKNVRAEAATAVYAPLYPVSALLVPDGCMNQQPVLKTKLLVQLVRSGLIKGYKLAS